MRRSLDEAEAWTEAATADRRAMRAELDAERGATAREAEARVQAERTWRDGIDALRLEFDRERATLQGRADQLGREADAARRRAEALDRERSDLAARLGAVEAARREAERGVQVELDRLTQALDCARRAEAAAIRRGEELAARAQALTEDRDRESAEREQERQSSQRRRDALERELEAARTRPAPPAGPGTGPAERADPLDAELQAARVQIAALNRDLALAHLYAEDNDAKAGSSSEADDPALLAARLRIEQLSAQLTRANLKNKELQGALNQLGVNPT